MTDVSIGERRRIVLAAQNRGGGRHGHTQVKIRGRDWRYLATRQRMSPESGRGKEGFSPLKPSVGVRPCQPLGLGFILDRRRRG